MKERRSWRRENSSVTALAFQKRTSELMCGKTNAPLSWKRLWLTRRPGPAVVKKLIQQAGDAWLMSAGLRIRWYRMYLQGRRSVAPDRSSCFLRINSQEEERSQKMESACLVCYSRKSTPVFDSLFTWFLLHAYGLSDTATPGFFSPFF